LVDILSILLAFSIGIFLRFQINFYFSFEYTFALLVILSLDILYLYLKGIYDNQFSTLLKDIKNLCEAFFYSIISYTFVSYLLKIGGISRWIILSVIVFGLLFQVIGHVLLKYAQINDYKNNIGLSNLLIVGDIKNLPKSLKNKLDSKELGFNVCGYISNNECLEDSSYKYLGKSEEILNIIGISNIDTVLITEKQHIKEVIDSCLHSYIRILSLESFMGCEYPYEMYIFDDYVLFKIKEVFTQSPAGRVKRLIDFSLSLIALIILSPLFAVISILIKIDSKGPVFFIQDRVGINNKVFKCIKFRTMVPNAEKILADWLEDNPQIKEEYLNTHKLKNDPRITRVGKFLRMTSLDEIPQFFNVLKGDMSLVGPRPYMTSEISECENYRGFLWRVYPGITGLWQISGRSNTDFSYRVKLDMHYILNWSLWLDILILFKTIPVVLKKDGAY